MNVSQDETFAVTGLTVELPLRICRKAMQQCVLEHRQSEPAFDTASEILALHRAGYSAELIRKYLHP